MEHDNQPIPAALLSNEGPKEFNALNEHGEQVFTSYYKQVLAVAIRSWSNTTQ
jgi:hypothetical protein